jgi:hypothetical protein
MERQLRIINWFFIAVILSITLLTGCATRENIEISLSDPMHHPKLAQMQAMSIEERDGVIYFGESKKYKKRGITVIALKGAPYEMGYAHGVLLKDEMKPWFKDVLHWMKSHSFGTSGLETKLIGRSREIEQYIPEKYKDELKGLAAGSGIDYELILMLNTASTTAKAYFCTSVAVKTRDGRLMRSRSAEGSIGQMLKPVVLFINQPSQGYAFASVTVPGVIGVWTAMNETGLNIGDHSINKSPNDWKGIPNEILNRKIMEDAASVEAVGEILKKVSRSRPWMHMVTDSQNARIYEYDSQDIGHADMNADGLILTNYTHVLNIGAPYNCRRFSSASNFLNNHRDRMDVRRLVELNRNAYISRVDEFSQNADSHSLAIFIPETLDFWIAVDPPPASRGRWVGFNLKTELNGSGREPDPLVIPAVSEIIFARVKIYEDEPWTGKWKVESSSQGSGIWAMKQTGEIVKSTPDSAYGFKGRVRGSQLKGNIEGASSGDLSFSMEMHPDAMSFKGVYKIWGRSYQLKGRRIE